MGRGRHRQGRGPRLAKRAAVCHNGRIELSLTDRGLVDLDFLRICVAALSLTAGLMIGRLVALVVPVALVAFLYAGLEADWWGGGLADGWRTFFALDMVVALLAGTIGLVIHRLVARRWPVPERARVAVCALCLGGLAVAWYASTRPADVDALRDSPRTLYYLGDSFEGLRLTHASAGTRGGYFAYGDCEMAVGLTEGGCTVPLGVENVACPGQPTAVALWGGREKGQLRRARRALRVLGTGRTTSRPRVSFQVNAFAHCFPPQRGFPRD